MLYESNWLNKMFSFDSTVFVLIHSKKIFDVTAKFGLISWWFGCIRTWVDVKLDDKCYTKNFFVWSLLHSVKDIA